MAAAPPAPPTHNMKYRYLGNSGLLVSTLSFGCMTFGDKLSGEDAYDIMVKAYQSGVNFFDNAEWYALGKSEEIMGQVIHKGIHNNIWTREDLVISTKIFVGTKQNAGPNDQGLGRKHIIEGTKASLKRMQLDYVDVVFCHRPESSTPIEETVRAMNFVIDQGWAFYWGTSEWKSGDIIEACEIADRLGLIRPIVEQPQYHILQRSRVEFDYVNLYKKYKLGLTTWSPLAFGVLTGKHSQGIVEGTRLNIPRVQNMISDLDAKIAKSETLKTIAEEVGCSLPQLAIAWCASNRNVSTVMLGATSIHQLEENLKANEFIDKITPEVKSRIDEIAQFVPKIPEYDMWYTLREKHFTTPLSNRYMAAASSTPPTHNMKYRYLGNSGLLVSTLSFGCATFEATSDVDQVYDLIAKAYQSGVNFFDNAEGYALGKSEEIMGQVIHKGIHNNIWTREDLVISTKIFVGTKQNAGPNDQGLGRKHIIEGTKASLKRMQLDYVDVVFCHRPESSTPIEETVRAMNFVIDQGWAFYWGTSEWKSGDIIEACEIADRLGLIRPIVEQPQYHILQRSRVEFDYVNLYKKYKLGLTTWSPLCFGILTGKYSQGIPEGSRMANEKTRPNVPDLDIRVAKTDKLKVIADELGCSLAQLAIAWCASNRNVSTVILGASNIRQLEENLKANAVIDKITPEIKARIDEIAQFVPTIRENDIFSKVRAKHL